MANKTPEIYRRLKALVICRQTTVKAVAGHLGLTPQGLASSMRRDPRGGRLKAIAEFLDVSVSEFFHDPPPMEERCRFAVGDVVAPVVGPHRGTHCRVILVKLDEGERSGWVTVVLPNGKELLFAGDELDLVTKSSWRGPSKS